MPVFSRIVPNVGDCDLYCPASNQIGTYKYIIETAAWPHLVTEFIHVAPLVSDPVPYILGELRDNTASVGRLKKELSMVHGTLHIFFRNKTFLFVKIESWNFQQLFYLGFHETLQIFSSFRQTFRWHFCMGNKELSKLAEILWGFTK